MELKPHPSVTEFFHEAVIGALRSQGVAAGELTEYYLVNLLAEFTHAQVELEQPMALRLASALEGDGDERARRLKGVADTTLYVSGFFSESLARSTVDVDYYISVGEAAYGHLAALAGRAGRGAAVAAFADAYVELSDKFPRFVDVLHEISARSAVTSDQDVVRLYERWTRTRSEWVARRLRARGVKMPPDGGDLH